MSTNLTLLLDEHFDLQFKPTVETKKYYTLNQIL